MNKTIIVLFAMFLTIIFVKCTNKKAKANFSTTTIDFGVKLQSDNLSSQFIIQNSGDEDLLVQSVETDCGCTITKYSKSPIEKGQKRKIKFTYIPKVDDIGEINKQIIIKTNSVNRLKVITFHVFLKK